MRVSPSREGSRVPGLELSPRLNELAPRTFRVTELLDLGLGGVVWCGLTGPFGVVGQFGLGEVAFQFREWEGGE